MSELSVNNKINDYAGFRTGPDEMETEGAADAEASSLSDAKSRVDTQDTQSATLLSNTEFASKALNEANVTASERNLEMVMELASHAMPVDKETLQMLSRDLLRSPDLSPARAVEMKQQGIEPTPLRVAFFNALTDEGWTAGKALDGLLEVLRDTSLPPEVEQSIKDALLAEDLEAASILRPESGLVTEKGDIKSLDFQIGKGLSEELGSKELQGSTEVSGTQVSKDGSESQGQQILNSGSETAGPQIANGSSEASEPQFVRDFDGASNSQITKDASEAAKSQIVSGGSEASEPQFAKDGNNTSEPRIAGIGSEAMEPQFAKDFSTGLDQPITNDAGDTTKSQIINGSSEASEPRIAAIGSETPELQIAKGGSETARTQQDASLPDLLSKRFRPEPEELMKKGRISRYFREMEMTMRKLAEASKELGEKGQRLADRAENVRESFETMRNLSDAYAFIQLPIKMSEETVNGELLVYKRKHGKKDASDGVSVLLHLDMTNLGTTNVMIRMNKMNAALTFTLADEKSVSLLRSRLPELNAILSHHGYAASCKVEQSADKKETETPGLPPVTPGTGLKTYSFDRRA